MRAQSRRVATQPQANAPAKNSAADTMFPSKKTAANAPADKAAAAASADASAASASGAASVLACRGLVRFLGRDENRTHVLRGVDFDAAAGQTHAVVGPSGCGKSSLLYLLGLLDRPDEGEVFIAGKPMARASDDARTAARNAHLGFVFQFHFLLPEFTAAENVILPMRKRGELGEGAMNKRALALLEAVGLGEKAGRLATHLSGGEQQRVAIARSLANEPPVILADEPTGNLDAKNSAIVFDLLARLAREHGIAVVMVTHNPELANRCDRVLRMLDGQFLKS
ncbi:MAG: ABC transporter ATP-binding protein [Puniceicoccales bacterium]|jgi:lipoprotein-releasing system ATP-binding protein|nr:ABC transporter ATP-binding protein [Puniceicoccales bacterium]